MKPQTVCTKQGMEKTVPINCISNDTLDSLSIKDDCFLMLIVHSGTGTVKVKDRIFEVISPCFVCFDESEDPVILKNNSMVCDSVYFHPMFLNVNMTFEQVHSVNYWNIALNHDMFLLQPFTDKKSYVYPIYENNVDRVKRLYSAMERELELQRDWYWSCRGRSYFMELILILERLYGIVDKETYELDVAIKDKYLRNAIIFIESNYTEDIELVDIVAASGINHSSLNHRFKHELGVTPVEYLMRHRISVACKHLEFTDLAISEIALRCGFKTLQHFSRKFKLYTGATQTDFRQRAVAARKSAFV